MQENSQTIEPKEYSIVFINGVQYEFKDTSAIETAILIAKALEEERKQNSK